MRTSNLVVPPWLSVAYGEYGVEEIPGPASNPRIDEYHRIGGGINAGDETAWCASFVGFCIVTAGFKGTGRPNARSYLDWGKSLTVPRLGCIVVLWRGEPDGAFGHVAFLVGMSSDGRILYLLGGNQGNKVAVIEYPAERLLGYRWLKKVEISC